MIRGQTQCVRYCLSSEKSLQGFCIPCTESSCSNSMLSLNQVDDITFYVSFPDKLLDPISLKNKLQVSFDSLSSADFFRYRIIEDIQSSSMLIRFEFYNSFNSENLNVSFSDAASKPSKLSKEAENPGLLVTGALASSSTASAQIAIEKVDPSALEISHLETQKFAINSTYDQITFVAVSVFTGFITGILILSAVILLISNLLKVQTKITESLRIWFVILALTLLILSTLSLINFSFPDNFESFASALYRFSFGLDDIFFDVNFTPNEPHFFRTGKSNSLMGNTPFLFTAQVVFICFYLLVIFFEQQPGIYRRWKTVSMLVSPNTVFLLIVPFLLECWLNSLLTFRAFVKNPSGLSLDFIFSLVYSTLLLTGICY